MISTIAEEHTMEPTPLLILKDRLGAFADLWMDYGKQNRILLQSTQAYIVDSAGNKACSRQLKTEKNWEKDLLETDFIPKSLQSSHYYCPVDKVAKSLSFLLEIGWTIQDFQGNRLLKLDDISLSMESEKDKIIVKGKVNYGHFKADLQSVIGAFNRKERFVSLGSGSVGLLPHKWEDAAMQTISEEAELIQENLTFKKSHIGTIGNFWKKPGITLDPALHNLSEKIQNFKGLQHISAGKAFQGSLRAYQQEGLDWLNFLHEFGFHGILADDMGLGKTVQVLAFLSTLPTRPLTLIVLPSSLLFNWKKR